MIIFASINIVIFPTDHNRALVARFFSPISLCYNLHMPPHGYNQTNPIAHPASADATTRIRQEETNAHFENRLRILKSQVVDKEHALHDTERDMATIESSLHRINLEEQRLEEEVRRMSIGMKTGEGTSKQSEMGMRETNQALQHKEDEMKKLEREIAQLHTQITEKEGAMSFIKQEVSKLMKEKEDFRREHELGHFAMKSEGEHVHERVVHLTLMTQDRKRKENELAHKQQMHQELKRDINFKDQEIKQVEAELGHMRI